MSPAAHLFAVVCAFVFGINIGSFLNVVIWRLPRGGSISTPTWSYCPRCEHRLGPLDLVPVLSFLVLGRRCRYCHDRISWRYPAIELLTGLLFMAVAYEFGFSLDTIFYCIFAAILVAIFFIDLEHFIIPDGLNVSLALVGFAHNAVSVALHEPYQFVQVGSLHVPSSATGFLIYGGLLYTIGLGGYIVTARTNGKRKNPFVALWEYIRDNALDWLAITVYYLGAVIPPLRRYVEPPEPMEGWTAEEIEADEEAGAMGGGDLKFAAAIGANIYVGLALQSFLYAIVLTLFFSFVGGKRLTGRTAVPFGPGMAAGALASLMVGNRMLLMYLTATGLHGH